MSTHTQVPVVAAVCDALSWREIWTHVRPVCRAWHDGAVRASTERLGVSPYDTVTAARFAPDSTALVDVVMCGAVAQTVYDAARHFRALYAMISISFSHGRVRMAAAGWSEISIHVVDVPAADYLVRYVDNRSAVPTQFTAGNSTVVPTRREPLMLLLDTPHFCNALCGRRGDDDGGDSDVEDSIGLAGVRAIRWQVRLPLALHADHLECVAQFHISTFSRRGTTLSAIAAVTNVGADVVSRRVAEAFDGTRVNANDVVARICCRASQFTCTRLASLQTVSTGLEYVDVDVERNGTVITVSQHGAVLRRYIVNADAVDDGALQADGGSAAAAATSASAGPVAHVARYGFANVKAAFEPGYAQASRICVTFVRADLLHVRVVMRDGVTEVNTFLVGECV